MRFPRLPKINKSLSVLTDGDHTLAVGGSIYYVTSDGRYTIKKGVVKEIHQRGHQFIYEVIVTLEDGTSLNFDNCFFSKTEAISHAITQLKQSIASRKIYIESETHKMAVEEKLLEIMNRHYG